jgi:uncharacterized protein YgiM (DUF1202 family)
MEHKELQKAKSIATRTSKENLELRSNKELLAMMTMTSNQSKSVMTRSLSTTGQTLSFKDAIKLKDTPSIEISATHSSL